MKFSINNNWRPVLLVCVFLLLVLSMFQACRKDSDAGNTSTQTSALSLRWNKAYSTETKQNIETGLQWCFSFLGASLPSPDYTNLFKWKNDSLLQLQIDKAGFNQQALDALQKLHLRIMQSEEYRKVGGLDIGRYVMLLFNSSYHYYQITGVQPTLTLFKRNRFFDTLVAAVKESCVSKGYRRILRPVFGVNDFYFIAEEIDGSLETGAYTVRSYEVFDVMPNGQLRFAIYDKDGNLIPSHPDSMYTLAGKPAKCLWCHETSIQQPFFAVTDINGYMKVDSFRSEVFAHNNRLNLFRQNLTSSLDFAKKQDHTYTELLYITFMEPTAERLSREWNMTLTETMKKLQGFSTHKHSEFTWLGDLYDRREVDLLSPYEHLTVPSSAREFSVYEPNLIK